MESGDLSDEVLSARPLYEGWMTLLMLRVRANGEDFDRALLDHPSGSQVLAYDPVRRVALTGSQLRLAVLHENAEPLIEAVGGVAEDNDAEACARREALEEAGVRLSQLELAGRVWMTPSSTTERVHLYLGAYGPEDRVGPGGGLADERENIVIEERPLADLWHIAQSGEMMDAKLMLLLQALYIRRPELFA